MGADPLRVLPRARHSPARSLADLKGGVFLLNSPVSNSGMNLPRRALAEIAGGKPFFREVIETGGHPGEPRPPAARRGRCRVDRLRDLRVLAPLPPRGGRAVPHLAETPPSPAIPFVTSVATPPPPSISCARRCARIGGEPRYAAVRAGLMIAGIEDVPDAAYRGLLDYEREAAELGYPQLV
jgi:hypothetical protein